MYVERIPNRNSPPAILLRESYRQGDKFKRRTLANLSDWPAAKIEALRRVLGAEAVVPADQQALRLVRSLPHGHVAAALGMLRKLGLDRILSQGGRQPRREDLDLFRGSHLSAGEVGLQPRWQATQAPDRVRAVVHGRGLSSRGRSIRRQCLRPFDGRNPNHQAQAAPHGLAAGSYSRPPRSTARAP